MKSIRKIIALLCCVLCMTGMLTTVALAQDEPLDENDAQTVETEVIGALVGAEDGAQIEAETAGLYDTDGNGKVTAAEIAGVLSKYAFAKEETLAGAADAIAADATFTVTVTKDGVSTVYIAVPVEDYPQLFNAGVFDETVKKLAEAQEAYKEDGMTLMSYEHIAGELALHAAVYAVTYMLGADQDGSVFHSFYESARIADLNVDENRAPGWFLEFFGKIVAFLNQILAFFNSIRPF
jgi:hypothetical protein